MIDRLLRSFVALGGMSGLLLLLAVGIFAHRDLLGVDIMEARNLITAREMIDTGQWFLPTMFGQPRLAKPPLPTWLTAMAMLGGNAGLDTDLAVNRIPSALAGLLLAASLFGLTRFWTKSTEAAAWATAFLATSYMFVLMARRNSWDIYCHAFMLAAIWALAVIADSPAPRKRLAVVAGVLLGLSGLSKGPVSFYALLAPWIVAMLATGGWRGIRLRLKDLGLALGLGLALSVVWPVAAWVVMPGAFSDMVAVEQAAWMVEHTKPFWFYLQFPLMTGVWTLMACAALWPGHARSRVEPFLPYWRPALWTLICVGLLMLVPEKKDRYLLPVLIPLCQLMGVYLTGLLRDPDAGGRVGRFVVWVNGAVFGLVCLAAPVGLWWLRDRFTLDIPTLGGVFLAGVLGAALLYRLVRAGDWRLLFGFQFRLLGLLTFGLPALVHPPAGDMSVPLAKIRALTAGALVVRDTSLKFQDFWVLGGKPLRLEAFSALEGSARVCFASREEPPVIPGALRGYVECERLDVSNFSGKTLHLTVLRRETADRGEKK